MENIENLKILQTMAKEFTILFVEDSKALQKQVVIFLEKFFKKVYIASDGIEGLELYKNKKPDLIITDLTMPKMNGHDMIREIKKIDADIEIIILSAHSDPDNLMTSFHIGVSDFIQKPITVPKMVTVFLKVLSNINRKKEQINTLIKNNNTLQNDDILNFIYEDNLEFDLINYYKGVPIINSGKIIELNEDKISVKTTFEQLMAIKHEKMTVIDCAEINENLLCKLLFIDFDNYVVKLQKDKIFFPDSKHRNLLMVKPNLFLNAKLEKDNFEKTIKVLLISLKEIKFEIKKDSLVLSKHDNIKLILEFDEQKIFVEGTVFKIEDQEKLNLITMFVKNGTENQQLLEKYIYSTEVKIIEEFKKLYLHN